MVTAKAVACDVLIFILIKPFSDPSQPLDEGIKILEETIPIRTVKFYH